ncbi:MAG: CAP domain-containing protein [Granulosicoccus sp.]
MRLADHSLRRNLLLGIVLLNVACSTGDPLGTPALSAAVPETSIDTPFTSIPTSEQSVVPSTPPDTSTTSEQAESENETMNTEILGTVLPQIPTSPPDAEELDPEELKEVAVTRATCSSSDSDIAQRMLQLINEARATTRSCGSETFSVARALSWNTDLVEAAREHSDDMATHNFFDHSGSDGRSASDRVTGQGYRWRTVGENIAAGRETAEQTVDDWLESPGHCRNIMNPSFVEVAVACVENNDSDYRRYWTNVLAAPR